MSAAKKALIESLHSSNERDTFVTDADDQRAKLAAFDKALAVTEFSLDGVVLDANGNFLQVMGYSLAEVRGKHHRTFCDPSYTSSHEYLEFWRRLSQGEFVSGEFRRIGRNGKSVWILASYTAACDDQGTPCKIIEVALDITRQKEKSADYEAQIDAISKSQAIIEFDLDGIIRNANETFLSTLGYGLDELKGRHHRMLCDPAYASSREYKEFWEQLTRGKHESGEFKRIGKGGKEVWIAASYNPILDSSGRPYKIIKFATDVSKQKLKDQELAALSKTQAVINFNLDGTIIDANENFLRTMGCSLEQIKGKHHEMFCDIAYASSLEYREFWTKLRNGQFVSGQFQRIASGGRVVWLQASYNPVFDLSGKVFKVVKYATDITKEKNEWLEVLKTLGETASQLAAASEQLVATATQLADNSSRTREQSVDASTISQQVTTGVQRVATNTEEMSASIKEISRSTSSGSVKTRESLKMAQETRAMMGQLGDSSKEIGTVIKVISSIAQQTNLLALNATIEAARAGDAGRGFAVVANEVKELAKQTAKATEEISVKVGAIQGNTDTAIAAIAKISQAVEEIDSISASIASAVEEQAVTTSDVARVVSECSRAVENISSIVKNVSTAAVQSSTGAAQVLDASRGLGQLAIRLKDLVVTLNRK